MLCDLLKAAIELLYAGWTLKEAVVAASQVCIAFEIYGADAFCDVDFDSLFGPGAKDFVLKATVRTDDPEAPMDVDNISLASKLVANYVETKHGPRSSFVAEFMKAVGLAASSSGEPKTLAMALEWLLTSEDNHDKFMKILETSAGAALKTIQAAGLAAEDQIRTTAAISLRKIEIEAAEAKAHSERAEDAAIKAKTEADKAKEQVVTGKGLAVRAEIAAAKAAAEHERVTEQAEEGVSAVQRAADIGQKRQQVQAAVDEARRRAAVAEDEKQRQAATAAERKTAMMKAAKEAVTRTNKAAREKAAALAVATEENNLALADQAEAGAYMRFVQVECPANESAWQVAKVRAGEAHRAAFPSPSKEAALLLSAGLEGNKENKPNQ